MIAISNHSRRICQPLVSLGKLFLLVLKSKTLVVLAVFMLFAQAGQIMAAAPKAPGSAMRVGVVSGFPRKNNKLLVDELKKRCAAQAELRSVRFDSICTLGDPAEGEQMLARYRTQPPDLMIYLDGVSAAAYADRVATPCLAIVSAASTLAGAKGRYQPLVAQSLSTATLPAGAQAGGEIATWLLETTPRASLIAQVLSCFKPTPVGVAVAYIGGDASHEKFLADLDGALKTQIKTSMPLTRCPLPAASCNNAGAIQASVQYALAKFPRGGILLVLPGNNTLKFPFVFAQYAEQRQLLLIGLGDFNLNGGMVHLGCTPATLAESCLIILARKSVGQAPASPLPAPRQQIWLDSQRIGKVDYTVDTAALKRLPALAIAEGHEP